MELTTHYLGLKLDHPLVPSAGPLTASLDMARRLEDAGAAAVVLPSLFEEQVEAEIGEMYHFLDHGAETYAEAVTYLPRPSEYRIDPDTYLEHVSRMKGALHIPVIASINGVSAGGWTRYATYIQEAGADALELNIYHVPTDPRRSAADVEDGYLEVVRTVRAAVHIPLAVKLSPFFSSLPHVAKRMAEAGANGLVLFNRFYQPDLDLELLEVVPEVQLSRSNDLRMPLRWIAILSGQLEVSLAGSGGVHSPEDVVKLLLAGADVTMTTAALLKRGPEFIGGLVDGLKEWMERHEYRSVADLRGAMSHRAVKNPGAFERANYMKAISRYEPPVWAWSHSKG